MFTTNKRMFGAFPAVTVVKTDYTTKAQLKISSGRSLRTIKNYQSVPVAMAGKIRGAINACLTFCSPH